MACHIWIISKIEKNISRIYALYLLDIKFKIEWYLVGLKNLQSDNDCRTTTIILTDFTPLKYDPL